jgi:hypothetical protein
MGKEPAMERDSELEALSESSEFVAAVVGIGLHFTVIPLGSGLTEQVDRACEEAHEKGYKYCGLLAVVGGVAASRVCEEIPDAAYTLLAATGTFVQMFRDLQRAKPEPTDTTDFQRFADALWALRDDRPA